MSERDRIRDRARRDAQEPRPSPSPEPAGVLGLQANAGNAAVSRLLTAQRAQVSRFGVGDVIDAAREGFEAIKEAFSPVRIAKPVGRGAKYDAEDVQAVRRRLILLGFAPPAPEGPGEEAEIAALAAAIERFQREHMGLSSPDGRVDPGGRTLRALNLERDDKTPAGKKKRGDSVEQDREDAVEQASLTAEERETSLADTGTDLGEVAAELKQLDADRKAKTITQEEYKAAKGPLQKRVAELKRAKARWEIEGELKEIAKRKGQPEETAVEDWFQQIEPDATFLGVPIGASSGSASPGVHKQLADKLRAAEAELEAHPERDAIQIHRIGGLRPPKPATGGTRVSMHCYGLAIDIDADANPFVRGDSAEPIERARLLISGIEGFVVSKGRKADAGAQWDVLEAASEDMRTYFALTDEAAIEGYLSKSPGAQKLGDAAWWKAQIAKDEKALRGRETWHAADPTKGMMTLHKVLVETLVKHGLDWGGQYGGGKDIMHFDYRSGDIKR
jgi:hypothetical protein